MAHRIVLVADRDRSVLAGIRRILKSARFVPLPARTAAEAMARSRESGPDAALVGLGLHDGEAVTLVRQLRQEFATSRIPIFLVARAGQETEVAAGLEQGAFDYLEWPAEAEALPGRLERILRGRKTPGRERFVRAGAVSLDVDTGRLVKPEGAARLTPCEAEILRWFLTPPGRTYTRRQLLAAHRPAFPPSASDRTVDVHVAGLRRKLGAAGSCIRTLRGVGYRFDPEAAEAMESPGPISA